MHSILSAVDKDKHARLFTTFGTVLYIDVASRELRHGPNDSSPSNVMFLADKNSPEESVAGWLMHEQAGQLLPITCSAQYSCSASSGTARSGVATPTKFHFVRLERGLVGLKSGDLYLCAESSGRITLSRTACSVWECFLPSEDWCTDLLITHGHDQNAEISETIDWRRVKHHIVNPILRINSRKDSKWKKILIFANTEWSNGRVYYDLSKLLYDKGYIIDILNWRVSYPSQQMNQMASYYDFILTGLDGIPVLVDIYGVPYEKIIGISHGIYYDLPLLVEKKGLEPLDKLANFGVVSYSMISESVIAGISRIPRVVSLGVNYSDFYTSVPTRLTTVGYATAMSHKTKNGIEKKRGELAQACAQAAGLAFSPAGTYDNPVSFHDMPDYYKRVDAVLMTSLIEAAGLPVLEAAAAGRLVIGTPVGHFPLTAYQGAGIIAPIEAEKFKAFTTATLRYYKENPTAYVEKCHAIQDSARKFDWQYVIDEWIELIETAKQ